jgi:hypothetical protein
MVAEPKRNLGPNPPSCAALARHLQKLLACSSDIDYYITKSPKHLVTASKQEPIMNTKISTKIAALGMALMMNGFILAGIAYLFDVQVPQHARVVAMMVA